MSHPDVERLPAALARRIALAAQGFAEPRPRRPVGTRQLRAADRAAGGRADRLGQRAVPLALPARSSAGSAPTARGRSTTLRRPRAAPAVRVLGARGVAAPGRGCSRCCAGAWPRPSEHAWGGMVRHRSASGPSSSPRCSTASASAARSRPASWLEPRAATRPGHHVGLARRQGRARVPVLQRRGHRPRAARRLRAPLRPARAGAAAGGRSPRPTPDRDDASASWSASPPGRSASATERDLRDYFRLPAADARGGDRRAGRGRRAAAGRRSRAGARPAYLDPDARRAAPDPRAGAARARSTRWSGSGPRVERLFGFRYRIEIYTPGGQAGARLLRAAVPARRPAGRAGRPQGRPRRRACCGCRRRTPRRARRREVADALAGARG